MSSLGKQEFCSFLLRREHYPILQALQRIEAMLGDEKTKREILERSVELLKQQVTGLQARIEDLEQRVRD